MFQRGSECGIVSDVKQNDAKRIGWYRFRAPPGLRSFTLPEGSKAKVWVEGELAEVREGVAWIKNPPRDVSVVALKLEMNPGAYAGAAFKTPPALELEGGIIKPGLWSDYALPTYSGVGVYKQKIVLEADDLLGQTFLDLGQVLVAAEVFVNGKKAGVRLARPFKFDVTKLLCVGDNTFEIRVANTIAPHYKTIPAMNLGPTGSGLIGPVKLIRKLSGKKWREWGQQKLLRLNKKLKTVTPELDAERKEWEKTAGWKVLSSDDIVSDSRTHTFSVQLKNLTGIRLDFPESKSSGVEAGEVEEIKAFAIPGNENSISGRFVRIEIINRAEYLALAEVQVFSNNKNIAGSGVARQSSTSHGGLARLAIDGNTDGMFGHGSVSHTNPNPFPWWEVNLGAEKSVDKITIWNRMDKDIISRLHGFRVSLLDGDRNVVWKKRIDDAPKPNLTLYVSGPMEIDLKQLSKPSSIFAMLVPKNFNFARGRIEIILKFKKPVVPIHFRLSMTRSIAPLCDIPSDVERILKISEEDRTENEKLVMSVFYLSVAPKLEAARELRTGIEVLIQDQNNH